MNQDPFEENKDKELGELALLHMETSYLARVIETVWYRHRIDSQTCVML